MFRIRHQQLDEMVQARLEEYTIRLAGHLRKKFPEQSRMLGQDGLLDAARLGLERARGHGVSTEKDICGFTELMFRYGQDFDTNPDLPFAARIEHERHVYQRDLTLDRLLEVEPRTDGKAGERRFSHVPEETPDED